MPNLSTQIHDMELEDTIRVLRYEAGFSPRVLAHLQALEKKLLGAYLNAGEITSQRKLNALLAEARAAIAEHYEAAKSLHDEEMPQFASIQAGKLIDGLNGLVKVDIFRMTLTQDQIDAIASDTLIQGAPSADWWAAQSADTVFKFSNAVRSGMLHGATGDEMARTVRDLMGVLMRNAQALVRTSVITVNNAAHMACYEANSDIMAGYQWVATLDPRTCPSCGALDGKVWPWGDSHPVPSLHWGCRCMGCGVTKSWEQLAKEAGGNTELARKLDQMPEGTRASMDGQVAVSNTYDKWLAGKTEAEQKAILGTKRFNLMQKGKLTLRDLTDQRGNELSLKALAENPAAIAKPTRVKALVDSINAVESKSVKLKTERGTIIDQDGSILLEQKGRKSSVSFDTADLKKLGKDSILTHNHPGNSSLSQQDFLLARKYDFAEIRAATQKMGTYHMRRPAGGWPSTQELNDIKFKDVYDRTYRDTHNFAQMEMNAGRMTVEQANEFVAHDVWQKVLKELNLDLGYGVENG